MALYQEMIKNVDDINRMPPFMVFMISEKVIESNSNLAMQYIEGDNEAFNILYDKVMRQANYRTTGEMATKQLKLALNEYMNTNPRWW